MVAVSTVSATHCLTTHSSRRCFATRLNSSVRPHKYHAYSALPSSNTRAFRWHGHKCKSCRHLAVGLAWGCWKSDTAEPGSGEHWLPLAGGTLLGVSRTVKQGKTVEFEFMQIRAVESGQLAFIAMPSGQKTVVFPLLRLGETEVVFENPQHDFPQRVIYQLEGETKLRARIEGMRKGALRVIEFPMNRVSCDSQLKLPAR